MQFNFLSFGKKGPVSASTQKWHLASVALLSIGLAACGGGGGGGESGSDAPLLAEFREDVLPSGSRVEMSGQNLFPMAAGDRREYTRLFNGVPNGTVTDTVSSGTSGQVRLNTYDSYTRESTNSVYAVQNAGIVQIDPIEAEVDVPGLYAALPELLWYPTPMYPVGGERRIVRQGNLKVDLDGDNSNDYFRFEFRQVFKGFESLSVLGRLTQVAHFTNSLVMSVRLTGAPDESRTVTSTEEAYFAPGIGLVKADRSQNGSGGVPSEAPYSIELTSAQVGGVSFTASSGGPPSAPPESDGSTVSLTHNDLVYDALRERYYASIPSSVVGKSNRIATLDANTGALSLSAMAVGSNPGPMAVSADGSTLYVGLSGSGELLRLSLPDLTETGRVALPQDSFFGQMRAAKITVSPVNANVVAVSLSYSTPSHAGVTLVRNMVVQPTRPPSYSVINGIAFDTTGAWVLGYNNQTTEFGLRRLEVLSNGLIEREVVATNGNFSADINLSGNLVMVGGLAYAADTLALRGSVINQTSCVRLRGADKVACVGWIDKLLRVADTATFGLQAELSYAGFTSYAPPRIVAGPSGQVALFDGSEIRRLTAAALR